MEGRLALRGGPIPVARCKLPTYVVITRRELAMAISHCIIAVGKQDVLMEILDHLRRIHAYLSVLPQSTGRCNKLVYKHFCTYTGASLSTSMRACPALFVFLGEIVVFLDRRSNT